MIKKVNERFYNFSVVIHPRGGEKLDWVFFSKDMDEYAEKIKSLKFVTPSDLSVLLLNLNGISQNSKDESKVRRFKLVEYIGQLEKGSVNCKPHYNLAIKTNVKILCSSLVRELSKCIYGIENCKSINVEPAHDYESLVNYCTKSETRLELKGTCYDPPHVDFRMSLFLEALEENQDLVKCIANQDYFKK